MRRVPMKDIVAEVQRNLPGTDKDRYDIAYERGRTQARSALATTGIALGLAAGTALMFFFDPVMGPARRAQLRQRAMSMSKEISGAAARKREDTANRAKDLAPDHDMEGNEPGAPGQCSSRT